MILLDPSVSPVADSDILLVEDHPVIQKITQNLFESLGLSMDIAGTGQEALCLFKPGKYFLVLMDIGLPGGMDGYDVTRNIRKMEEGTAFHVPIVGISAHAPSDPAIYREAGLDKMLTKPLLRHQAEALLEHYGIVKRG